MIEVAARFGRNHLCNLAALGTSSTDQRKPYEVSEGVALIYITGVLCNDAWYWDETEYSEIQSEVEIAAEDPAVKATLLIIDSPGGETTMAFETADALSAAAKKKPMWAVAAPHAYSAAYLMAAQAKKIYTPPKTGGVGSIGVYSMHVDYSGALEQNGIKVTFVTAGKGKVEGNPYQPLSEDAHKKIQAEVDRLYELFVASVSVGRGMTAEAIKKLGAVTLHGGDAIAAQLADALGTAEDAWFELASISQMTSSMSASAGVTSPKEDLPTMSKETTENKPADATAAAVDANAIATQARNDGRNEAVEIVELCQIAGKPALASGFITAGKNVKDVRAELLKAKADDSGEEITSHTLPATGSASTALDPEKNPLLADAKARAAKGAK